MGYCPPSVIQFQGRDQILVWSGDGVTGLAPSSGQVEWTFPWELRFALAVPTPRQKGNDLFLTSFLQWSTDAGSWAVPTPSAVEDAKSE